MAASGKKLVLVTPHLHIIRTIISKEGWHLEHGLVSKILKWGPLTSITDVRSFLGTAGVERTWIHGFSFIAKPLTLLTRIVVQPEFYFSPEAQEAQNKLKQLVSMAPILIKQQNFSISSTLHIGPWIMDLSSWVLTLVKTELDGFCITSGYNFYHKNKVTAYGSLCISPQSL